jgi:hypothetical protein
VYVLTQRMPEKKIFHVRKKRSKRTRSRQSSRLIFYEKDIHTAHCPLRLGTLLKFPHKTRNSRKRRSSKYYSMQTYTYDQRTSTTLYVRHAIHLQFDISTNSLEIRAIQSPKTAPLCVVVYTAHLPASTLPLLCISIYRTF